MNPDQEQRPYGPPPVPAAPSADVPFVVESYRVTVLSRSTSTATGVDVRYQYPVISLFSDAGGPTQGRLHALVYFYPQYIDLPVAGYDPRGCEISLHFHIAMLDRILALLAAPGQLTCTYKTEPNLVWAELNGPVTRRLT